MTTPRPLIAILAMAIGLASCTSAAEPTTTTTLPETTTTTRPTTTTTEPTTTTTTLPEAFGGEALVGIAGEPSTLNPLLTDDPEVRLIAQAWTTGVYDVSGETGDLIAEVVEELPSVANGGVVVNPDGTMTVSYTIRDDARWSDGTPISGADFQFTLETILDPGVSVSKTVYADIVSSTIGLKTFGYTLAFPTIEHERLFGVLIPQHQVEGTDFNTDWNERTWLSGGPFEFNRWIAGESVQFVRNDQYWKADPESGLSLPFMDGVTFQILEDPTLRFEAAAGRGVDVLLIDPEIVGQIGPLSSLGAQIETRPGPVWVHVNFQFGPGRWDRNPDTLNAYLPYRQAVMHAIDRERIARELFGSRALPLDSYVEAYAPSISGAAWNRYTYSPEAAIELLAAAIDAQAAEEEEATGDVVVFFTTNASNDERAVVAEMIGEMLSDVGAAFIDTSEDSVTFFGETVGSGRYDVGMWAWQASAGLSALVAFHDVLDPDDTRSVSNFYRWGTEESSSTDGASRFAQLLEAMRTSADRTELTELIGEAEGLIADQALILPLYSEPVSAAFWPDQIDGFVMNAEAGFTWNVEQWVRSDR